MGGIPVYIADAYTIIGDEFDGYQYKISSSHEKMFNEQFPQKRMNRISKLLIAARNGMADSKLHRGEQAYFFGTEYAVCNSIHEFDLQSQFHGPLSVNPQHFPDTVLNAPTCHLSIENQMAGPVINISSGKNSSLDAIGLGFVTMRRGEYDEILVGGYDELGEIQLLQRQEGKPICEAVGLLSLVNHSNKNDLSILAGYSSQTYGCSDFRQAFVNTLSLGLDEAELNIDDINYISICTELTPAEDIEILDWLKNDQGFKGITDSKSVDFMGSCGVVQVALLLQSTKYRCHGSGQAIINISRNQISVIIIK